MFRVVAVSLLLLAACRPADGTNDAVPPGRDTDPADLAWPDSVRFGLVFGDQPVGCSEEIGGVGKSGAAVRLRDARFFVHDLVFSGPSGEAAFIPDEGPWAHGTLVLVDLEDGQGQCATHGTAEVHDRVEGYVPEGEWDTLTFSLGVPFEDNHLPPSHSEPPLDEVSLFTTAQTGHVFLRADVRNSLVGPVQEYGAQITSGGCSSAALDVAPGGPCSRPGVARIRVPYQPFRTDVRQIVSLDLQALFKNVDVRADAGGPPGCRSQPDDTHECGPLFATLGMSFTTGACVDDCANQTAFRTICRDAEGAVIDCP